MTAQAAPRLRLRVIERNQVADGVVELVLADPGGARLPEWQPGAHIGLCLRAGLVRQYSLCGVTDDRSRYTVAVLREHDGRGGSVFVHDDLPVGTDLDVMPPRNNFELRPAPRYLFLAGGIGVTPLVPMIAAATAVGADWTLVYGGRTASSMAYLPDLTTAHPGRVQVWREDTDGMLPVDRLIKDLPTGALVYCCGPEGLLRAVEQACTRESFTHLYTERFTAEAETEAAGGGNAAFDVVLAQAGLTLHVGADRSILEVVEDAGIPVDSSCREGTCATCETFVLEGECDHRDSLLSEAERAAGDSMMICVSRARGSRLVLDI